MKKGLGLWLEQYVLGRTKQAAERNVVLLMALFSSLHRLGWVAIDRFAFHG